MCFSTSVTTRSPRPGEVDGKDYFFIDPQRFQEMVDRDELLEHAQYVAHSYGTPRAFVEQKLNDGLNVILDIEVQGARQVREKMKNAVLIFIVPPSLEELRRRLEEADLYDYLIINDDLETAAGEFTSILTAEHCRVPHRIHLLKDF